MTDDDDCLPRGHHKERTRVKPPWFYVQRVLCAFGIHQFYNEGVGPGCIYLYPRDDCVACHKTAPPR